MPERTNGEGFGFAGSEHPSSFDKPYIHVYAGSISPFGGLAGRSAEAVHDAAPCQEHLETAAKLASDPLESVPNQAESYIEPLGTSWVVFSVQSFLLGTRCEGPETASPPPEARPEGE